MIDIESLQEMANKTMEAKFNKLKEERYGKDDDDRIRIASEYTYDLLRYSGIVIEE